MTRIVIFALLLSSAASAQTVYTLEQAQRDAVQRSHDISIAQLAVTEAQKGETSARAQRLPRLDLHAGYTHVSRTAGIDLNIPGLPQRSIRFGDGNILETALTASAPLFTGFRLSSLQDISTAQVDVAEDALAGTTTAVRHRVAIVYRRAQLAMRNMRIYDEQLSYLRDQLTVLSHLFAQGQVLPYDTLVVSTRASALRVERRGARTEYDNAIEDLRLLTRRDLQNVTLSEDIEGADQLQSLRDTSALYDYADGHRSDLLILQRQRDMLQLRVRAEEASMYPTVSAFASYRYGRPGVDQIANEWMNYYTAGISLDWNLWSWGGDRAAVQKQQLGMEATGERYANLRDGIHTSIDRILNELTVLQDTRRMLEEQIAQEQVKQRLLQARFKEGMATSTEVVDAEAALTTARLRHEQAEIQYAMKITELASTIGWNE